MVNIPLPLALSAAFLARIATEQPERFSSLTLVTPTGFRGGSQRMRKALGSTPEPGSLRHRSAGLLRKTNRVLPQL
jgi:hypothetical protein